MGMDGYAKLVQVQMQTSQTALLDSLGLTIQTLITIRTPVIVYPASNSFSFTLGWLVDNATTNHLMYIGSNARWVSQVDIQLDSQVALIAACNQGGTESAVREALNVLSAVPEPSAGVLAVFLCAGATVRRWRKR